MSKENKNISLDNKKEVLKRLRESAEIYVIMSDCTRMPYVVCDSETYDDKILLYYTEENAKKAAEKLVGEKIPVQIIKVDKKSFLPFYNTLYTMGVNCIAVEQGMPDEIFIQLPELVVRPASDKLPGGKVRVENPEFHLTALYFVQGLRTQPKPQLTDELKELQEEMMVHYQKGNYIAAFRDEEGKKVMPILRQKDGQTFQPIFTDFQEFQKFQNYNRSGKFRTAVVPADKIAEILMPEAMGVTVNPFGVNLQLRVTRKK